MHTKKPLSIGFAVILLLSMAMTMPLPIGKAMKVYPPAPNWKLEVIPYYTNGNVVGLCNDFVLQVNITGGDIYGVDWRLSWNDTLLNEVSKVSQNPSVDPEGAWAGGVQALADKFEDMSGNGLKDTYHWSYLTLGAGPPFNGTMWLAKVTLHVKKQPYFPEPAMGCALDLNNVKVVGYVLGADITALFTILDGKYNITAVKPPKPKLMIDPPVIERCTKPLGTLFNISIVITDLAAAWDLWGWEAKLSYNTTMLDCLNSYEGPFLDSFAQGVPPGRTFYINIINDTLGIVHTSGFFLNRSSAPNGAGVVAKLEFNVSAVSTAPVMWECALDLYDTKLSNSTAGAIEHTVADGYYYSCYKVIGWSLDCYTDAFRKKCVNEYTTRIGVGINETADSYEPQDLVILFAYLEYNKKPEANKIVSFEIYGPRNIYYNVSVIRTAITNKDGIATINFTIPWPCEHAREIIFGHWVCYQAAQVKIYQKPDDWLWWKVGWIIEITDVEVKPGPNGWKDPKGPNPCEWIEIVIHYKTISFMPCNVLFSITVLDELLDPIQEDWEWVTPVPGTPYYLCSETPYNISLFSHIPQWAHVGKAVVYANAFTDRPMNCGCPFCPEVTEEFWIMWTP